MPLLPNLVSLTVLNSNVGEHFQIPVTLKELSFEYSCCRYEDLTALTRLTCLRVSIFSNMHNFFRGLTALTTLHHLEIEGPRSLIPLVGKLTRLTHLQVRIYSGDPDMRLTPPTCLEKLVHLGIKSHDEGMRRHHINNLGRTVEAITSLKSLSLGLVHGPVMGLLHGCSVSALSRLTALGLDGLSMDASELCVEGLQSLSMHAGGLQRNLVDILGQATALTKLSLSHVGLGATGLKLAGTSRLSRLQELSLHIAITASYDPGRFEAIGLLTSLTSLSWQGGLVNDADMEACLGLRKLRLLRIMAKSCVSPKALVAVAKLPELARLGMRVRFGGDRERVRALLDADRHAKGWPALELYMYGSY
jgi:hypothetical protein